MWSLFPERLTKNIPGDAITIRDLVFDFLFSALQNYPVERFIRQLIRKAALTLRKEGAQAKPQTLVLFARAIAIGTKPLKKVRKLFPRQFLFGLGVRQSLGPRLL